METIPGALFPLTFFAAFALERVLPRRAQPRLRWQWAVLGIASFFLGAAIRVPLPAVIASALAGHTLFDLSALSLWIAVPLVVLATSFVGYWLHRATHRSDRLWRWAHQMHHSAERVDIPGFAYGHPIEHVLAVVVITPVVALLGVSPEAAAIGGFLGYVLGLFQHMDLRTPQWLGYLVQRPEQHAVHHIRGVHAYNYGLPLFDLLFGTFRNPRDVVEPAGFWDGASSQVVAMLIGRDVSTPTSSGRITAP